MKLLAGGPSPFLRKVSLTAAMKGLGDSVEVVSPSHPDIASLRQRNPLKKIPVLLCDDGTALFDSQVICEYLDSLASSPVLFPRDGHARWNTLTMGALGDGILEAALLMVYEGRYRSEEMRVQSWVDMQQQKIDTALGHLEASPPQWGDNPDYGHLTVACGLGYLDFRQEGQWRAAHPKMVAWLDQFAAAVPGYGATMPENY